MRGEKTCQKNNRKAAIAVVVLFDDNDNKIKMTRKPEKT